MFRRGSFVALLLVIFGQAVSVAGTTSEAYDLRVQVGALPPDGATVPFSYTRFYPEHLQVHRGQTVLFENVEDFDLHTASFWPGGDGARPNLLRHDDGLSGFALNEPWQRSACGDDGQAACRLESSEQYLTSGLTTGSPLLYGTTWRVTVDLPVGAAIQYICLVHPGMTGTIEVVGDEATLPTQAQIDAQNHEQVAVDTQEAIEHRALRDGQVVRRSEGDRNVWQVLNGDSTPSGHVSIRAYMPGRLDAVRPGDAVEFVSSGMGHHSVTFPTELVGHKTPGPESRLASASIHPACDLDEPDGGAPGIDGLWAPFSPLTCPGNFELVIAPWLASPNRAPGDMVATNATYHDSGLMWSEQAPESARGRPAGSGQYFPHRFVAEFPLAGTFAYACTVHGAQDMAATIQVG